MVSEIADKLSAALLKKENDINRFTWKGKKVIGIDDVYHQEEVRLLDASEAQLYGFYKHCLSMLNNTDRKSPGRNRVLRLIKEQRNKCGVELFFRHYEKNGVATRHTIYESIKDLLEKSDATEDDIDKKVLADVVNCEPEFERLPLRNVLEGGIGKLGIFDRSHITLTFILSEGIWMTANELSNVMAVKPEDMTVRNYIRQTYRIPAVIKININPKGLSLSELKAMLSLGNKKYSELTDEQLLVLRNRVLFSLEEDVKQHIAQWEKKMEQILQVAEVKGIDVSKW